MEQFVFRRAKIEDANKLAELAYELNLYHGENIKPTAEKFIKDWKYFEAFVIETHGQIIAFTIGYLTYQFHTAILRFEIQNLHVQEEFRGLGVASMLFKNLILAKHKEGVRKFSLGVQVENKIARSFYEKFGFDERPQNQVRYVFGGKKLEEFIKNET